MTPRRETIEGLTVLSVWTVTGVVVKLVDLPSMLGRMSEGFPVVHRRLTEGRTVMHWWLTKGLTVVPGQVAKGLTADPSSVCTVTVGEREYHLTPAVVGRYLTSASCSC